MSHRARRQRPRHPERGTIAIIVAALWTFLFGMAALSVDVGNWYLARRRLQDVADAAIMAGLPTLGSNQGTAVANAKSILSANGYPSVVPVPSSSGGFRYLDVSITASQPSFFGKLFKISSKPITVTAQGRASLASAAIVALGNTCPPTTIGVAFSGVGFTITGDIQSNSGVQFYTGGVTNSVNGSVAYNPACTGTNGYSNTGTSISGTVSATGGSVTSPFNYVAANFTCVWTAGNLSLNYPVPDGTYCATGNISLSGNTITGVTARLTLVAQGQITISASVFNQMTANENGIIAYSTWTTPDCNTQAINIGSASVVMNGSFYAPNGCINASGNTMTYNGSLVGKMVQMGIGTSSTVTGTGGGSSTFSLYQ